MPTNKELEQRLKEVEERLNQPAETPPIKHSLSDEDVVLMDALKKDNETYGELLMANTDKIVELCGRVTQLQKLLVLVCAERGEFIDEPKALNYNLSKRMREILAVSMPPLSESMKDE